MIGRLIGWIFFLAGLAVLARDAFVWIETKQWAPIAARPAVVRPRPFEPQPRPGCGAALHPPVSMGPDHRHGPPMVGVCGADGAGSADPRPLGQAGANEGPAQPSPILTAALTADSSLGHSRTAGGDFARPRRYNATGSMPKARAAANRRLVVAGADFRRSSPWLRRNSLVAR